MMRSDSSQRLMLREAGAVIEDVVVAGVELLTFRGLQRLRGVLGANRGEDIINMDHRRATAIVAVSALNSGVEAGLHHQVWECQCNHQ